MKNKVKNIVAIMIACVLTLSFSCGIIYSAGEVTMDNFFKEYGESTSTFNGIDLLSLIPVRDEVNQHFNEYYVTNDCDLHCVYNGDGAGQDFNVEEDIPAGPYKIDLDIEKGQDYPINISVGTGDKAIEYEQIKIHFFFNTNDISDGYPIFDVPEVSNVSGADIDGTLVSGQISPSNPTQRR